MKYLVLSLMLLGMTSATYADLVAEVLYAHDVARSSPKVFSDWLQDDSNTRI
jgi:uncharacterized protein YkwD